MRSAATGSADKVISLIITTCDRPTLLKDALGSAQNQNHVGEIIVIDDGSEPCGYLPEQVRVIKTPGRIGICAARNLGLQAAAMPYIAYLDDDDLLQDEAYIGAMTAYAADDQNVVVSCVEQFDEDGVVKIRVPPSTTKGTIWGMDFAAKGCGYSFYTKQSAVYRTEFLRSIGGWESKLKSRSQSELYFRISQKTNIKGIDYPSYRLNRSTRHEHITSNIPLRIKSSLFLVVRYFGLWTRRRGGWRWAAAEGMYILRMVRRRFG